MKQCIVCNESVPPERVLSSHEKFGHVLCGDCYTRADEIGHIPAIVLNRGWDAYDEKMSGEPSESDTPADATDQSANVEETEEEGYTNTSMVPSEQKVTVLPPVESVDIVRPAISSLAAKQAWQEYLEMRSTILEKSDFQRIQGKDFIKKSGWRKFATFYNLTDSIVEEKRINCEDGTFIWKIKVLCTAPNGRVTEGVAMCSSKEKSGTRVEHDVYSTAHTRAKNRAISDMIAAGEVSAEEVSA